MKKESRAVAYKTQLSKKPLLGKTILITRAASKVQEFSEMVRNAGGTPVFFPTIEIVPPASWNECDKALQSIELYDALLFTSVNGVEWFFRRFNEHSLSKKVLESKQFYAVGTKTEAAVNKRRLTVTTIPESFTSEELSRLLSKENVRGKKYLFPRGDLSRGILVEQLHSRGATVDAVTVYRTTIPHSNNKNEVRNMLDSGKVDVITFTSPSTMQNFVEMFSIDEVRRFHETSKFAVIGPVTSKALKELEFEPDIVAEQSTVKNLFDAIVDYLTT